MHFKFSNGVTVSIIEETRGGKGGGLFEISAWKTSNPKVILTDKIWPCLVSDEESIIGWCTPEQLARMLLDAAMWTERRQGTH
jgi:hypothetical protein